MADITIGELPQASALNDESLLVVENEGQAQRVSGKQIKDHAAAGAAVQSVNGKTGAVSLSAADVKARPDTWTPTAAEVGAIPSGTKIPAKTSDLTNDSGFITEYTETDPTVPAWAKNPTKPTYSAADVGADPEGSATEAVGEHNVDPDSHNDIRSLIEGLASRLNALANSDDATLDQMAEVVAYIKANRTLIESITTSKVNVSDIVNNLTTNVSGKPLSAAQGVALKGLIDAITVPTKVSQLDNDKGFISTYTETDPTVPAWAKSASKPSYTAEEVGALPKNTPIPSVTQTTGDSTAEVMSQAAVTKELSRLDNEKVDVNAQSLTEMQKAQVRKNIGADTVLRLSKDDLEDMADADLESKYQEGVRLLAVDDGYTNLVPLATNLHGAVYCGCGYITGYRMSSDGTLSKQQWACVSGFIPFEYGKTIRIVGATGPATNSSMYIALYDEAYTFITVLYLDSVTAGDLGSYTARKDGFYEATFNTSALKSGSMYNNLIASSYIRVSLNPCEGGNMIVTYDQEIPEV